MSHRERQCSTELNLIAKSSRRIAVSCTQTVYDQVIGDSQLFRDYLDQAAVICPELFPPAFADCVLGASVALKTVPTELTEACGEFKREVVRLEPAYEPQTVNYDGWEHTRRACQHVCVHHKIR
ncbi:MAG: hypothetical protein K8S97_12965 [Anaerolineae bacterium]|nr:hypothetical protein [Anaerolineae bacterium]